MKRKKTPYKYRILLTTLIVLTLTAIAIAGFILAWDIFDINGRLTDILDTNVFGSDEPLCRSDTAVNIVFAQTSGLPDAEKKALSDYFTCYYAALGSFYRENISKLFTVQCRDELFDCMALEQEIAAAKSSAADYSFKECEIRLTVRSRRSIDKEKPDTAQLEVEFSAEIPYGFSETPVRVSGEKHTFKLTTSGKSCLIYGHTTERPSRAAVDDALNKVLAEAGYTLRDISYTYFSPYTALANERLSEQLEAYRDGFAKPFEEEAEQLFPAEYDYDREAAAEYAKNAPRSAKYGDYEENDVNLCSQSLAESGIPMDAQGDRFTQWKWYGYEENNAREHSGCTKSWYDRERFWTYAAENTGFGLVAQEAGYGDVGDIIQLMNDGEPILQAMITGTVNDRAGLPADYLICTDKLKNIPLSLVWTGERRVLRILGYNTANI